MQKDIASRTWWHAGCTREVSNGAAGVAAAIAMFLVGGTAALYINNHYGPFGEHGTPGFLIALALAATTGLAVFVAVRRLAHRSWLALVPLLAMIVVGTWIALPRQIDVNESWVPRPNARYSCTGWEFQHYPPRTYDANAVTYCVGLEHRIADG